MSNEYKILYDFFEPGVCGVSLYCEREPDFFITGWIDFYFKCVESWSFGASNGKGLCVMHKNWVLI